MKRIAATAVFLIVGLAALGQRHYADSLRAALRNAPNDSVRYVLYMQIGYYYQELDRDSSIHYYDLAVADARKHQMRYAEAGALGIKGYQFAIKGRYAESLQLLSDALNITNESGNENNSWFFSPSGLKPKNNKWYTLARIQLLYSVLMHVTKNTQQEIFYLKESIKNGKRVGDPYRIGIAEQNLGNEYRIINKPDSALIEYNGALKFLRRSNDRKYIGAALTGIGETYLKTGNMPLARQYLFAGMQSSINNDNLDNLDRSYYSLTNYYLATHDKDSSLLFAKKTLQPLLLLPTGDRDYNLDDVYENLARSYRLAGQQDSITKYEALALAAKDSIYRGRINDLADFQNLGFRQQMHLRDLEKERLAYQNRVRVFAFGGAALTFLIIGFMLWRNTKKQKHTNLLLSEQKEEISAQRDDLESKNQELEIEAALERVRTVAIAMRDSNDLSAATSTVFTELRNLGISPIRSGVGLIAKDSRKAKIYSNTAGDTSDNLALMGEVELSGHPAFERQYKSWLKQESYFIALGGKELVSYYKILSAGLNTDLNVTVKNNQKEYGYWFMFPEGFLYAWSEKEYTGAETRILERFKNIIELTFRRYVELKEAEAQARESQIQLALERVRARTMAMQKSEELSETVFILFQQFKELGENPDQATIGIVNEDEHVIEYWVTMYGNQENKVYKFSIDEPNVTHKIYNAWKHKKKSLVIDLSGKKLLDFAAYRESMGGAKLKRDEKRRIINVAFFSKGLINVQSTEERSEESVRLLERFAAVFDGTYTRFLDLQKAEVQAREAKIEAALEKVRSRSLAMHHSSELEQVVASLFDRLVELGLLFDGALIYLFEKEKRNIQLWIATIQLTTPVKIELPYDREIENNEIAKDLWHAIESGEHIFNKSYSGEVKNQYFRYVAKYNESKIPKPVRQLHIESDSWTACFAAEKNSIVGFDNWSGQIIKNEDFQIAVRFARVFEQSYTRFLDLQKAEAQAREAQIEAALEKVRSRSLAMHHSDELQEVVTVVFEKLHELAFDFDGGAVVLEFVEGTRDVIHWTAVAGKIYSTSLYVPYFDDSIIFSDAWNARQKGIDFFAKTYNKKEKDICWNWTFENTAYKFIPDERKAWILASPSFTCSVAFTKNSAIAISSFSGQVLSEQEVNILKRLAKVFEQVYVRFLDLKKSEAQARESQIQLALERVRAHTMAMQKSEELAETAAEMFRQMISLGIEPNRLYIGIITGNNTEIEFWITDEDGAKVSSMFIGDAGKNRSMKKMYDSWVAHEKSIIIDMQGDELAEYFRYLGAMQVPFKGGLAQKRRVSYISFFSNGFIGMASPNDQPQETIDLLDRFAHVFNLTYTRFLDLKKAEEQARESQIQLALERVRARTMAMQKSEELHEVIQLVFDQLQQLNFDIDNATFALNYLDTNDFNLWIAVAGAQYATKLDVPYFKHPVFDLFNQAKRKGGLYTDVLSFEEKNSFFRHFFKYAPEVADERKAMIFDQPGYARSTALMKNTALSVSNYRGIPFSEAENNTLLRFGQVFDETYTRFNDLKQAEEQARESQVQLGLERVRAAAMAMHNSQDVGNATALVFSELYKLGINTIRCGVCIVDNMAEQIEVWSANMSLDGKVNRGVGKLDMTAHPLWLYLLNAWRQKIPSFSYELKGKELADYYGAIRNAPNYEAPKSLKPDDLPDAKQYCNCYIFNEGCLFTFTEAPFSPEISQVLERFAAVFGLTYRRYLDLTKAEAQAREAQIEAALEKIRSTSLAMHRSDDIATVVTVLFEKLKELSLIFDGGAGIHLFAPGSKDAIIWVISPELQAPICNKLPYDEGAFQDNPIILDVWKAKDAGKHIENKHYSFEQKNRYFEYVFKHNDESTLPKPVRDFILNTKSYTATFIAEKNSLLGVNSWTEQLLSEENIVVLRRVARVFEQAYIRFLDLQKAEAQAREAQVEAALERVRSKAMAMRSSNDLNATANTVFIELRKLGVDLVRCGLGLQERQSHISTIHAATNSAEGGSLEVLGKLNMEAHPVLVGIYKHWRQNEDYFPVLEGESLRAYYEKLAENGISVPEWNGGEKQFGYFFPFADGSLYAWSGKQESDETVKTLKRFTSVIGLTYTRYMELQKAELNAKEAIKQASLDRVRAEIASMRKRSDLERITPLIWDELTILGIPFIRCGVFIMDEEQQLIHTFLSTPDGKAIGAFHVPFDTSGNFEKMVDRWRHKVPYIDHWKEEAFSQFADTLVKQGAIASKAQYMKTLPHEGVHLNFLPFLQGMLYVGNREPLEEDNINLIQAVAEAFSTAYARYEDFNKLEAAKQQVDNTLTQLRATQNKLIQSEKMASLGELTAGIAHEIQNPLNFVNNFSEVSAELIDEMDEELDKGDVEEAKAIASDIKNNLEKIRHHGKRADGIVKGMLQHSRASSNVKEPTDVNKLADEYLHLAYHGLRAKDKSFNAELTTHLDEKLPKANVVPQDIGRVILNMINNAFYAVQQKGKNAGTDYKPEVTVSTCKEDGQVMIRVKDNGNGIPSAIKDKIMQPFFTTKPTGEGTGLGLSLSYDIVVKGHGGKIDVETKEGEFTAFTVTLPLS